MKIRNKWVLKAAGWTAARAAMGLVRSLRVEHHCIGPEVAPGFVADPNARIIYACWHEYLLVPTAKFGYPEMAALVSKHADGQLLGALLDAKGVSLVLGSTNRGGVEAVRQIVNGTMGRKHLAVTPDGPRGPRREVQPGVIYAASRAGMQIVTLNVGLHEPWRAGSWDSFAIPKPCSRAKVIFGEPITVPPRLRTQELEPYRLQLQAELDRLTLAAENWAKTNRLAIPDVKPVSVPQIAPSRLAS